MREFIEDQYGVEVIRWAEPTEDGELYEARVDGRMVRADSPTLLLAAVQDVTRQPARLGARLAWTNVIAGTIVMPMQCAA